MKKIFLYILPLFISVGVSQDVIYTTTLYNDENFTGKNSRVESITYYKKTRNGLVKFRYEEYYKLTGNLFIKKSIFTKAFSIFLIYFTINMYILIIPNPFNIFYPIL